MKLNRRTLRRLIESTIMEVTGAPVIHDKEKIISDDDRSLTLNPKSSIEFDAESFVCYVTELEGTKYPDAKEILKYLKVELDGRPATNDEIDNYLVSEKTIKFTNMSDDIIFMAVKFETPEFAPSEYYGREDERPPPEPGDPLAYRGGANPSGMSWAKDIDTDRDRTNPRKK